MNDQSCTQGQTDRPEKHQRYQDYWPAEGEKAAPAVSQGPRHSAKDAPQSLRQNHAEKAGPDPRIQNREEDVREKQDHQQRPGNGLNVLEMHRTFRHENRSRMDDPGAITANLLSVSSCFFYGFCA